MDANMGPPAASPLPRTAPFSRARHHQTRTRWIVALTVCVMLLAAARAGAQSANEAPAELTAESVLAPAEAVTSEAPIPTRNLLELIRDGGLLMLPIGICSFILFIFVFERAFSLRRARVVPGPFVRLFIQQLRERQLDRAAALKLCEENKSPVAIVFAGALKKWGRPSVEVEQAIIDSGERVVTGLRRYLRLLNGIATLSPLLGLMGTVFGMISSFNSIATANAMGRPELLAGGISEALITTAAGLTVAIPALTAYLFFLGRVDRLIIEIDALGQQVVECIAADAWQEPAPRGERASGKRTQAA